MTHFLTFPASGDKKLSTIFRFWYIIAAMTDPILPQVINMSAAEGYLFTRLLTGGLGNP